MASLFFSFLHSQFMVTPPTPSTDCAGKTIIITGANAGLGKEAARHYVSLNAEKVIITARNQEKGSAAQADIEATTGRKGVVEVWSLDLCDYDSVKAFAKRAQSLERIDTLVENAGVSTAEFAEVGGNETTITVNVVSTFLLALLMLPKLQETAGRFGITPTLTIVSSEVHMWTSFPERKAPSIFENLNTEKEARMSDRYLVSKLLEVLVCREITKDRSVDQMKVTLNFMNPGWCKSELMRDVSNPAALLAAKIMCRTTEVGSRTLVNAGLQGKETHGKYLSDCKVTPCAALVEGEEGPELQRRVWKELAEKLNEIEPGITKVLDA